MTTTKIQKADTQAVARYNFNEPVGNGQGIVDLVTRMEQQFAHAAGTPINHEKTMRMAMLCRMAAQKVPQLLQCSRESWLYALLDASKVGLEPDGEMAALIPYGKEVRFAAMYRGLLHLVADAGICHDVEAVPVFKGDKFRVLLGTHRDIEHEPDLQASRTYDDMIACYAVFRLRDGSTKITVMSKEEIQKRRDVSRAKSGPWFDWPVEQSKKTVIRNGLKLLPRISLQLTHAVDVDTRADIGSPALSAQDGSAEPFNAAETRTATVRGISGLKNALAKAVDGEPTDMGAAEAQAAQSTPLVEAAPTAITDAQRDRILNLLDKGGAASADKRMKVINAVLERTDIGTLTSLTWTEANEVIMRLEGQK